ncbi:unnamed protein product [Parnassius apollo]|uniref:(apollo) hypothetical protein n=1 Tax=Parnassius apollo TaxID=110799 RepID=A0A8S3WZ85_PARAO|nr:unnamed protein product [Parnassius apollo]
MYTDNWYTSVDLADKLPDSETHLVGMLRKNRKRLPQEVTETKLKLGEYISRENQRGITVMKWRDKREVLLLSTKHSNILKESTSKRGLVTKKPKIILSYNQAKSAVDLSDQMSAYSTPLRKTVKWYRKLAWKSFESKNNTPTNIVLNLCSNLFNKGHTMYTDNWYTSVDLADKLPDSETHLVGMLRKNRKRLPKEVTETKLKLGEYISRENQRGITVMKWRDKREVLLLSTKHSNILKESTSKRGLVTKKPKIILSYNQAKSAVDLSDQMSAYSTPLRKTVKWYRKLAWKSFESKNNTPTNIVLNLCSNLFNKGHTMYTDNWYTSVDLADKLPDSETHLVGMLRKNRKRWPKEVTETKLKLGEYISRENQRGITVMKWRDKREVLLLSTKHSNILKESTSKRGLVTKKPKIILSYNQAKSAVDLSDQMSAYSTPLRKTVKWYRKLAYKP